MRKHSTLASILFGLCSFGCGATPPNSYDEAADEVDASAAALTADNSSSAVDPIDDVTSDDDSQSASDAGAHHPLLHRLLRRNRPRGGGLGLLVWYSDLDALAKCRDLRDSCKASSDPNCSTEVKDCVLPVLEQAFSAMCEERVAMCQEKNSPKRPCQRVEARCEKFAANHPADARDAGTGN